MAEYKGKKVKLNNPRRIGKGETSYGKKKSVVYVMDGDKVDITAITQVQRQRHDTGRVERGEKWQKQQLKK